MLYPVLRYGYKELAPKGSRVGAVQLAQSHVRKECIELDDKGVPFVNPEKVLVFRGKLNPPVACEVEQDGINLHFRWRVEPNYLQSFYKFNVLIYEVGVWSELKIAEADAEVGQCTISFPVLGNNQSPLHVYVGLVDTLEEVLSDSVYLGVVG